MSHGEIVAKLNALVAENAFNAGNQWTDIYTKTSDAGDKLDIARQKLATEGFWTGKGPAAALHTLAARVTAYDDSETGIPALAGKMSTALAQDGEVLTSAHHVAQAHPELGSGAPTDRKKEELEAIRNEAQRLYTTPLEAKRPEITDSAGQPMGGSMPQGPGANNGNGGGGSGSGGSGGNGTQTPPSSDGLANKDTKPQLAGGDGQQAGAGQGQGSGGGQGSGSGGQGSGSGAGSGSGGAGSGLGSGAGGSGLPIGSTTAAGFSPSSTGTAGGGSGTALSGPGGLSALRGGGLPGGAVSGTGAGGVNPAAMGAAGVRGGPMGMMGGAGGHGKGGKGEEDDDHATPSYLINVDNGNELFGETIKASPGVIGDWTESEEAEKKAREAEIRRYKSMGWDVKFE
ncbi:hypothetical protein DE4585_03847 [Mycobacteroides salmoniphilum]|uniref:PPE family protein n=2 Tax=Mycobacteroides salmoniphilum TaxID=404941 RepID=A0A4R8RZW4_9MYCO|nr:hypothetical protein DE4585_03847 [Mycobacteroides salmoniphilum]